VTSNLLRLARLLGIALLLAVASTTAAQSPRGAHARCGWDETWWIENELFGRKTMDRTTGQTTYTDQYSDGGSQRSNKGEEHTSLQTHETHADGSSSGHEEFTHSDPLGKGCNSDGKPRKWSIRRDDETDSDGNRKEHTENLIIQDGKCEKWVRDREWDRNGNLIKDTQSRTEVPCGKYSLEIVKKGNAAVKGGANVTFGPNAVLIPLAQKENTHTGSYQGKFNSTAMGGGCSGIWSYPISFDITAVEDEFDKISFTVQRTITGSGSIACPGGGGASTMPSKTKVLEFVLPAAEGAAWVEDVPIPAMAGSGSETYTFTLRTNPQ
jgi:hypothetical protein